MEPWTFDGNAQRVWNALEVDGIARVRVGTQGIDDARNNPWSFAEKMLGKRIFLAERQRIRAVTGGRSFSSGMMEAPYHTDSQLFRGGPPDVQLMVCVRSAQTGGASTYLDTRSVLERWERSNRQLFERVFTVPRRLPFVFGDVYGPTISLRGKGLAFTHPPAPLAGDRFGAELQSALEAEPRIEFVAESGACTLIDNRRLLHGRRSFSDPEREFVRILVWLEAPVSIHAAHLERALAIARQRQTAHRNRSAAVRKRFGVWNELGSETARQRLLAVLDVLRGLAPGVVAAREGVAERELYRWRDDLLDAGLAVLEDANVDPKEHNAELDEAWETERLK